MSSIKEHDRVTLTVDLPREQLFTLKARQICAIPQRQTAREMRVE